MFSDKREKESEELERFEDIICRCHALRQYFCWKKDEVRVSVLDDITEYLLSVHPSKKKRERDLLRWLCLVGFHVLEPHGLSEMECRVCGRVFRRLM